MFSQLQYDEVADKMAVWDSPIDPPAAEPVQFIEDPLGTFAALSTSTRIDDREEKEAELLRERYSKKGAYCRSKPN